MKRAERRAMHRLITNAESMLSDARFHLNNCALCLEALRDAQNWVKRAKRERKRIEEDE